MQFSSRYTVLFAGAVCIVCSVLVASSAVLLEERQERNRQLDRQRKVLAVAGVVAQGESLSDEEVQVRFDERIRARIVDLQSGNYVDDVDPAAFDQQAAKRDPERSRPAPDNRAKVRRVPNRALVYHVMDAGRIGAVIVPIEGKGLWSTLYGYLALAADARTIRGITFYDHGETPGLGGEVDNPRWKGLWSGRKAYDEGWKPKIRVIKGQAGPAASDPHRVDGLSGATITSRGVTSLLQFWLGESGFGPYLSQFRNQRSL